MRHAPSEDDIGIGIGKTIVSYPITHLLGLRLSLDRDAEAISCSRSDGCLPVRAED
jgi:hypothetical protein